MKIICKNLKQRMKSTPVVRLLSCCEESINKLYIFQQYVHWVYNATLFRKQKHDNFTRKKAKTIDIAVVFIQSLQIEQSIPHRSTLDTGCQYTCTSIRYI